MPAIYADSAVPDATRRKLLFEGNTFFYEPRGPGKALCQFAWELIQEAFAPIAPEDAQREMPVEQFVKIISPLKTRFTHHARSKELLRDVLEDAGCDVGMTYFDVPKLRIVTSDGYLSAGVGYAYKSHRDTWYACPPSQINWWTPISEITPRSAFVIHPNYFARAVPNNSNQFDAYQWNADGRKNAARYITEDPRPHPHLTEPRDLDWQVILGGPGSLILFSAQHLHATVPNTSGRTRFSIDFRTVHRDDVVAGAGAQLVDNASTGTTLRDFLRATDYAKFGEDVVAKYDKGGRDGVLVFDPSVVSSSG